MSLGENEVKTGVGFEWNIPALSEDPAARDLCRADFCRADPGRAGRRLHALLSLGLASLLAACAQSGTPAPVIEGGGGSMSPPMAAGGYGGGYGAVATGAAVETGVIEGGGGRITVRPGETLYGVARRMHVPPRVIVEANNLQAPYRLQIGQTITVPHVRQHVVQPGETLASVTRRYGGDPATVARLNHLAPSSPLRQGDNLILTEDAGAGGGGMNAAAAATPAYLPLSPPSQTQTAAAQPPTTFHETPAARPAPAGKPVTLAPQGGEKQVLAPPSEAERAEAERSKPEAPKKLESPKALAKNEPAKPEAAAEAKKGEDDLPGADEASAKPTSSKQAAPPPARHAPSAPTFFWPVRGHVIGDFGSNANGTHNDGINIAAPAGSTVYAAENGVVTYSGNELKGFGNLLLIKHDNGYVSAYAHNQVLLVKKGDRVRRGQPVARVGSTGGVNEPQLHFELRQGVKAVDPLDHLPQLDNQ